MTGYMAEMRKLVGRRTVMQCAASVICVDGRGRILLGKRSDNHMWGYSGGAAEIDERAEDCAKRELLEEMGLTAEELEFFCVNSGPEAHYIYPNGDEVSNFEIVYICRKWRGEPIAQDGEMEELRFFSHDEIDISFISPPIRPVLRKYISQNCNASEARPAELWDAYDGEFNKISNVCLVRGEPIPKGMYHLVCDVIVRHNDDSYLLMQRDKRKYFGGMWEATAGGSALRNESPYECAVRELYEETGVKSENLTEVGRVKSHDTVYVEFLCVTDHEKDRIVLQEGETSAYRWVSAAELRSMKKSELVTERMQRFIPELHAEE